MTCRKENLDKAIAQFQAILKIQPDDAYSELWLARLYRFENQHGDAEKVLRDLLQRDPGNGAALEQLSQLLMDEGRSQEAVKILADAANDSSSPEVYDLLGDAYSQSKEYSKAEDAYRKAVEEDPDDPGHLHGLAQALMAQDKYAEALEQFKRLAEVEPGTAENYLRMAQLYRRWGNSIRRNRAFCARSNWRRAVWKCSTTKRCYTRIRAATTTRCAC